MNGKMLEIVWLLKSHCAAKNNWVRRSAGEVSGTIAADGWSHWKYRRSSEWRRAELNGESILNWIELNRIAFYDFDVIYMHLNALLRKKVGGEKCKMQQACKADAVSLTCMRMGHVAN